MKKISTMRVNGNMIFKGHKLTIGLDLGDRWSFYCVLDEAGKVLLEQKVAMLIRTIKFSTHLCSRNNDSHVVALHWSVPPVGRSRLRF